MHGQSGTGKTISLGKLAYDATIKLHIPVLYIERRSIRLSVSDIDEFCKWAEDNNAPSTLIIWDGMEEPEQYYQTLRYLLSRGRKALLVGSSISRMKKLTLRKSRTL